jgi:hypothetical protein
MLAAAVVAAGCGGNDKSSSQTSKSVGAPGAKVSFVTPTNGAVTGSPVLVKVKVTGFKLAPGDVGKAAKQGEGHLHFAMDGGKYDRPKFSGANGKLAARLGVAGRYSPATKPTIVYRGLPRGRHTLIVFLANNDHTNTGVRAQTKFTVK